MHSVVQGAIYRQHHNRLTPPPPQADGILKYWEFRNSNRNSEIWNPEFIRIPNHGNSEIRNSEFQKFHFHEF